MKNSILQALAWRYGVKIFDPSKTIANDLFHTILESGRLSPSSYGLEAWKFIVVENPEIRAQLRAAGYDQPKITDAAKLIVITYRTDVRENITHERINRIAKVQEQDVEELSMMKNILQGAVSTRTDEQLETWIKAQAYIPLGIMIETAALLGVDSGPMEGFDANKVDEILGLPEKHLHATSMLALGYRGEDPVASSKKVRQDFDEVVEFIK